MKTAKFKELYSKVVLESEVIFAFRNQDNASMHGHPVEQIEMQFDCDEVDGELEHKGGKRQTINFSMSESDIQEQNAYFSAAKVPLKELCFTLNSTFPDIDFAVGRNTNNNSNGSDRVLVDRIQIKAVSKSGDMLTKEHLQEIHSAIIEILDEANSIIDEVNKTVEIKDISSVILCSKQEAEGRTNAIIYKNRGAGMFAYAFFNAPKAIRKKLLRLRVGKSVVDIMPAKPTPYDIEYSSFAHVVSGNIQIESSLKHLYVFNGNYAANDGGDSDSVSFRHKIRLSKKQKKNDQLINLISTLKPTDDVIATIYPVQPYVCIAGIRSKKLSLVDLKVHKN